jgi:hypothetical protein
MIFKHIFPPETLLKEREKTKTVLKDSDTAFCELELLATGTVRHLGI